MTAFLKIDDCNACLRSLPWEWVPAVLLNGKPLAGTAVWRSQLIDGRCHACRDAMALKRQNEQRACALREGLIQLLGGEKPYREFTFERYQVTADNRLAYERSKHFNPAAENLYLWGPCGVGKTHLAYAAVRRALEETLTVAILCAFQVSRRVRMKEPASEQAAVDEFSSAEVLVLDDLGTGPDTAFTRQILQEILDARDFNDRGGLVVTSRYSLNGLAAKFNDDAIPSRLAGLCRVLEIRGSDQRLASKRPCDSLH